MNKVMYGEIRRRGGRNTLCRLLRPGRWFLCLALLCSAALPGFAGAATGKECTDWKGQTGISINLHLPPSVSFEPDKLPAPGQVLYTSPAWYQIQYKCKTDLPGNVQPALTVLSDAVPLLKSALADAGLKLQILIDGMSTPWDPVTQEKVSFGPSYNSGQDTGEQTLRLKAQLVVNKKISSGFYAVPALTAFKLISSSGYGSTRGLFLATTPVRIQYVPTCFVKTSLPEHNVDFGPVITTDVDSSFSRVRAFQVQANANTNCQGDLSSLTRKYDVYLNGIWKGTYYLELPLKVSFVLNNGGVLSSDNKSIILYKGGTETKNGLQLQITDSNGTPVTFGEISTPGGTPPPSANQFGEFNGESSTWNVINTYSAVLSSANGPVKTGKYSAQVTVKVEYY